MWHKLCEYYIYPVTGLTIIIHKIRIYFETILASTTLTYQILFQNHGHSEHRAELDIAVASYEVNPPNLSIAMQYACNIVAYMAR